MTERTVFELGQVAGVLLMAASVAACDTITPIAANQNVKIVEIDGLKVYTAPMPAAATWGATRSAIAPLFPVNPATEPQLLARAIELASGCKIVTSHYGDREQNLYATVNCKKD